MVEVKVKWGGQMLLFTVSDEANIGDLKQEIYGKTKIKPERQKIIGIKAKDDDIIQNVYKGKPIMLIGTPEADIEAIQAGPPEDLPEVINDLEDVGDDVALEDNETHLRKIRQRVEKYQIQIMNEPREGSKLLVLDIDYTLFDHRSTAERAGQLMRPYLHEFLTESYNKNYDIVIWSATGMKWIEVKMRELGVLSNPNYKIAFMLDSKAMITVFTEQYGVVEVKPLGVIWGKYSQWSSSNTIMFDDLRRNFLMNPQTGLKIRPFKNALTEGHKDKELKRLTRYLKAISDMDDFTSLDHRNWEKWLRARRQTQRQTQDDQNEVEE